ncbi:MAG: hypothetical protein HY335_10220 [Deinococcus sp.]|nr:hypothetical protein [Deinococcus sp.]
MGTLFLRAFHLYRSNLGLGLGLVLAGVLALVIAGGSDLYLGAAVNVQPGRDATLIQIRLPFARAGGEQGGNQPPTRLVRPSERQQQVPGVLSMRCRFCPLRATRVALTLVLPVLLAVAGGVAALATGFALLRALSDRYLGRPIGMGQALRAALGKLGAILWWTALWGMMLVVLGMVLARLPFPFWLVVLVPLAGSLSMLWGLSALVLMFEAEGGLAAIWRGLELALAFPGRLLGIFSLVMLIVGAVLGYPLTALLPPLAEVDGLLALNRVLVEYWPWFAVPGVLVLLLFPFALAVLVCAYYDLRARERAG